MYSCVMFEEKWPVLVRHERAAEWLQIWSDLGRAARTIDAYGRGLAEFLELCEREGLEPLTAGRADVAVFVRDLMSRPHRQGANVVSIDSGAGSSNATIQQRLLVTWNQALRDHGSLGFHHELGTVVEQEDAGEVAGHSGSSNLAVTFVSEPSVSTARDGSCGAPRQLSTKGPGRRSPLTTDRLRARRSPRSWRAR